MIENIDRLSYKDKLFMIHNPNCFSLPTISTIHFNREKWMEEIEVHLHPDVIKNMINAGNSICSIPVISSIIKGKLPSFIEDKVTNKMVEVAYMPCETRENISDIISVFGYVLRLIDSSNVPYLEEYKRSIVKYVFDRLLPWKLQAHEIYVRTNTSTITADKILQEYSMNTLRWLFKEMIVYKYSYEKISVVLYQICKYLDRDEKSTFLKVMATCMNILYNYDFDKLMDTTVNLLKESVDALTIINNINEINSTEISHIILTSAKDMIEHNYERNKISTRINNGGLCVGDDVFDNGAISASRLLIELDMINEDRIKDYIGENKNITFTIPENDIGYLRLKQQLPICKVMTREDGFYTLSRYEDKSYLLFKIIGDSKCYGISFPSEFGGQRKVVMFDIPTQYEYVMSMT